MGKMLDPQNVTMRAERMMKGHLRLFEEYFGAYEREGSHYCFEFDERTAISVYYENYSRLLTKTFSTAVRITIQDVEMDKSWNAKLNLNGKIRVETVSLKALDQDSRDIVDELNRNTGLSRKMLSLFKDFDLQGLTLEYRREEKEMNITVRPYPGAFLWVKLPPLYYDIRLKPEEIKRIYEIAELFSSFCSKNMLI